jgi:phosphoribosylformylglycinamidine cyclo-ligase
LTTNNTSLTYRDAGVDIDAGDALVDRIKPFAKRTMRPEVLGGIGGFGALFEISKKFKEPVLVSGTDGVGTKLKLAFHLNKHDTVGQDLVAMSVNDILVQGAEPLFFLDYFATGRLDVGVAETVIRGIAAGCRAANCSLVGGETAELPGFYADGEYDLAGFSVGIADRDKVIDGSGITVGDQIIGVGSSGLHSNGYSLARKVLLDDGGYDLGHIFPELGRPLVEELLTPTRIYVRTILNLLRDFNLKGMAHITGGGVPENLPRVLPQGCRARVVKNSWQMPAIFHLIRDLGKVDDAEMQRTFNCGLGMALVVPAKDVEEVLVRLKALGEKAWVIGEILERRAGEPTLTVE